MNRTPLGLLLLLPLLLAAPPGAVAGSVAATGPGSVASDPAFTPDGPAPTPPAHGPAASPIHTSPRTGNPGQFPDARPRHHNGDRLVCSECHLTSPADAARTRTGSNPWMLKADDPLDLCLGCHDGMVYVPDVVGADVNGLSQRSAGHFEAPEAHSVHGHSLGRNLPGGDGLCTRCHAGGTRKVTCIDCHDPHGNNVARNLQWASDPGDTPDLGLFVNPAATGMSRYEASNVSYGTLNSAQLREASSMCLDCHHTFSGTDHVTHAGTSGFVRHPSYDSERGSANSISAGAAGGHTSPGHWLGGTGSGFETTTRVRHVAPGATGYAAARQVSADNGVFCLSCHRAHGSDQPFGLVWEAGSGSGPAGCDQCHLVAETGPLAADAPGGGRGPRLAGGGDPVSLTAPGAPSKIRPKQKR